MEREQVIVATIEPGDRDEFDALMADIDFGAMSEVEVVDYTEMSTLALEDMLEEVKEKLYDRHEMLHPFTEEGNDLHAKMHGLLGEKHRRRGR